VGMKSNPMNLLNLKRVKKQTINDNTSR
jgi:hypothetical protein